MLQERRSRHARAPIRIRTEDPFITNEVLYQLSYWGYAGVRLTDRGAARKAESVLMPLLL